MNVQQIQKWARLRTQGRTRYIVKRALLWGAVFSIWKILMYSLHSFYVAPTLITPVFHFIFKEDPPQSTAQSEMQTLIRYSLEGIGMCIIVAAFLAFTIWTIKEREYETARESQQI